MHFRVTYNIETLERVSVYSTNGTRTDRFNLLIHLNRSLRVKVKVIHFIFTALA